METRSLLFAVLFSLTFFGSAIAQEKSINANSGKKTTDSRIANLLNSKTFEFVANTVLPTSGSPKNLVGSGYSVTFSPEMVISYMPFYGRAYSGMALGRDKGMRFQGKAENFTITKKNNYEVNTTVNGENDTYSISISVSDSGFASLSISSNNRETISYHGEIK